MKEITIQKSINRDEIAISSLDAFDHFANSSKHIILTHSYELIKKIRALSAKRQGILIKRSGRFHEKIRTFSAKRQDVLKWAC